MKRGDVEKWGNLSNCTNLLFFSQLVNELLFDYSIPSNRIATLNSHFLCLDAISAIDSIESRGVPEGTLRPIVDELFVALSKDPVFEAMGDNPLRYFVKYQDGKPRAVNAVSELNYEDMKKSVRAIRERYFWGSNYYNAIRAQVTAIVVQNAEADQPKLFRLVKSLLTELVNCGYSRNYIYMVMCDTFWKSKRAIDNPECIEDFFSQFTFEEKEYDVVLIVNRAKSKRFVDLIDGLKFIDKLEKRTDQHSEHRFLVKRSHEAFITLKRTACDPFAAAENAKETMSLNISLLRLYDHDYRYDISGAKCGVYCDGRFLIVHRGKSAVAHIKTPSNKRISDSLKQFEKILNPSKNIQMLSDAFALLTSIEFHAQSLDSGSLKNQLLDLWSIFEIMLDISNKHTSDRIQQVCMYLVPILKRHYIYSLFAQLASDIRAYSEEEYLKIVGPATEEKDIVRCVCEFVVLPENAEKLNLFLGNCSDFPLLTERIQYYSQVLSTPKSAFSFVEKHASQVRWQIMRSYRNRNLIIHNGDEMPYLDLLVENLHAYVDDFINYLIRGLSAEHSVGSMCQELFAKECEWADTFAKGKGAMTKELVLQMLSE